MGRIPGQRATEQWWTGLCVATTLLLSAACGAGTPNEAGGNARGTELTGSLTVKITTEQMFRLYEQLPDPCRSSPTQKCEPPLVAIGGCRSLIGGFSDLHAGTPVVVSDEAGKIIATGALEGGDLGLRDPRCTFGLKVPAVPKAQFYKVEIARRGGSTVSHAEMISRGWRVELTI